MTVTLNEEVELLQRRLDGLVRNTDDELMNRYDLRWPRLPPGIYWQLRWLASSVLRGLESMGILRPDPWPVKLKHAGKNARAKPVLIWAVGTGRDSLRDACNRLSRHWDSLPGFAPVLITDVADFAFFSRLGWLVEYVPRLTGDGEPYEERKLAFLARLYRGAPALPVSVGLEEDYPAKYIRRWLERSA